MNWRRTIRNPVIRSVFGAAITVLAGLVLLKTQWGGPLINYSYDALSWFNTRSVPNNVTFILADDESFRTLHQKRGTVWDRRLHARLLDKLAIDNCSVVVMDLFFPKLHHRIDDRDFARAIKRHNEIVLRAGFYAATNTTEVRPVLPEALFLNAAGTNWGISHFVPDADGIVRKQWPFPSPGPYPSLAETAARTDGATLNNAPHERWLRYYGQQPPWRRIRYELALQQPLNFFHNDIVFIGIVPAPSAPPVVSHKFKTPYTRWNGQAMAGTELVITEFLNLVNHESLRRWNRMTDMLVLLASGIVIGAWLPRLRLWPALIAALGVAIVVIGLSFLLTATTNFWFPYLLIVGGQLPIALVCATIASSEGTGRIPGYRLVKPAFGHGAYGNVWLARNKAGQWRAVKVVSAEKFGDDRVPYDREYEGVTSYREICDRHPGLLRVEFVSEKFPTHFYYVMELGDALEPGWQKAPRKYKPRDLNAVRSTSPQNRLPTNECVRIGLALCDTLDFIHRSGLTHRDIKPQNILFVNGQPKLADVGLITQIRSSDQEHTLVGTPGYMPPLPESPGTAQADIYALGMVLYVIATGRNPALFPELSATLLGGNDPTEILLLNTVVLKACQPNPKDRFPSAREMYEALEQLNAKIKTPAVQ